VSHWLFGFVLFMDKELEALPAGVSCSSIRFLNFVKLNEVKKGSYSALLIL